MKSYKHLYSESLKQNEMHFAAHSHHPWPDCTLQAHIQYWKDSAKYLDGKWDRIFSETVPQTQKYISEVLNLSNPEMIALAPNTHEFVTRLFSCFEGKIKVLTTDSEFHSFRRQLQRLVEAKTVDATVVPVEPCDTFDKRWRKEAQNNYDMIFTSQVFFNSGLTCPDLNDWVFSVSESAMIVVDGYHAFCAIPTNLKKFEDRIFYIAGGYKYAQSGEGVCFMSIPKTSEARPMNTGWFASFETLNQTSSEAVRYSNSGMRFFGSTFDASGCYRFNSVMENLKKEKLDTTAIHARVNEIKKYFVEKLNDFSLNELNTKNIVKNAENLPESHFLTFKTPQANHIEEMLRKNQITVDSRGDRLRFGFGIYHDLKDIDLLTKKLSQIFKKTDSRLSSDYSARGEVEL